MKRMQRAFFFSDRREFDTLDTSNQKEGINVVPEVEVSQACDALVSRLETARKYRTELEARLEQAKRRIMKAEAYREIMNLMSAHVHCCLNQIPRSEVCIRQTLLGILIRTKYSEDY